MDIFSIGTCFFVLKNIKFKLNAKTVTQLQHGNVNYQGV